MFNHVHENFEDFNKLPIPFFALLPMLETGRGFVKIKAILPAAIMASWENVSIPYLNLPK